MIITTLDIDPDFGDSSSWFEEATAEIYLLPQMLHRDYWEDFLEYVVETKGVDVVLIAGSEFVYHQLPSYGTTLRSAGCGSALQHAGARSEQSPVRRTDRPSPVRKREVRDWLVARGQDEASVVVIESGVDTSLHRPVERQVRLPLRVGFSGRLSEEKAPLAFVDLAQMLPDSRFHF